LRAEARPIDRSITNETIQGKVQTLVRLKEAYEASLDERVIRGMALESERTIRVNISPHRIMTMKLGYASPSTEVGR